MVCEALAAMQGHRSHFPAQCSAGAPQLASQLCQRGGKEWVFLELVIGRWTTVCHWLAAWTIRRTELTRGLMGRSPGYLGRASVSDNYIKNGSSAGRAWSRDEQSHVTQLWWPGPSSVELGHVTSPAVQCTEPTHHRISRVSPTPSLSLLDHVSHLANGLP